jgi:hypothetical protein
MLTAARLAAATKQYQSLCTDTLLIFSLSVPQWWAVSAGLGSATMSINFNFNEVAGQAAFAAASCRSGAQMVLTRQRPALERGWLALSSGSDAAMCGMPLTGDNFKRYQLTTALRATRDAGNAVPAPCSRATRAVQAEPVEAPAMPAYQRLPFDKLRANGIQFLPRKRPSASQRSR